MVLLPHLDPVSRIRRLVGYYDRGMFTALEVAGVVLESIDAQNAGEILGMLPAPVVARLAKQADEAPRTGEWAQLKLFNIHGGEPLPVSSYRAAIEVLRVHLKPSDPIA